MTDRGLQSGGGLYLAMLGILVLGGFVAVLGNAPLFDVDEGAFSEATREMAVSGNYLTTYLNGIPRFDKPILIYWFQLLSIRTFGLNEFALRLPSALFAGGWAMAMFLFARREFKEREAFLGSAMLVLSLQVTIIAKAAIADALLNFFLALTMLAIMRHYRTGSSRMLLIAFAAMGLGMLTKGPIALLIPIAVTFLFNLLELRLKEWFRMVLNPWGILLFLAIALPWYLLEYRDQGMAFIEGFFLKHNVNRFSSSLEGHSGSLFYYIPVILIGLLPFTGLFFTLLFHLRSFMADRINRFLFIWAAFVFVFFSLSGTKLPHYMIYGYTPLFLLMARALPLSPHPRLHVIWPLGLFLLILALPLALPEMAAEAPNAYVSDIIEAAILLLDSRHMAITLTAATAMGALALWPRMAAGTRLIATGIIFSLFINLHVMPLAGKLMQEPVKEAALLAKRNGWKIVMWKVDYPSFLVYSESFVEKRAPRGGEIVLTTTRYLDRLESPAVLYRKNGIVLLKTSE
ncbi:MAG: glycosyltransferase family 39 protein [Chlorobium sp.]|nr:glycosyltransferase family 39 protein [Chlorobium sp.]